MRAPVSGVRTVGNSRVRSADACFGSGVKQLSGRKRMLGNVLARALGQTSTE
jgi:hypothetical protein